jgi:hypothetical protein
MKPLQVHTGKRDSPGHLPGAKKCRIHVNWDVTEKYTIWQDGKFSSSAIDNLKSRARKANNAGMVAQIIILSTSSARKEEWRNHSLNNKNGGPINAAGSGVDGIYKNYEAQTIIRTLLTKIHLELNEQDYNVEIYLMWENFAGWDRGGKDWAVSMAIWWRGASGLSDSRPIGTGVVKCTHLKELNDAAGPGIIGFVEAWNYSRFLRENWVYGLTGRLFKLKWQWVGFWPDKVLFYEQKIAKLKELYFTPGKEIINAINELKQIYKMIRRGINPAYHFDVLLQSNYWERKFGFSIPKKYDTKKHQAAIEGYFVDPAIKHFIDNPGLLKTRKGKRKFKKVNRKYLDKLRGSK